MSTYEGPAIIISNGAESPVTVQLHTYRDGGLRGWRGVGYPDEPGAPDISLDMAKIRLPDGREADADVSFDFRPRHITPLDITGSGRPPFDA